MTANTSVNKWINALVMIAFLGTIIVGGCKDETTLVGTWAGGRESLSDPSVMPVVVATVPFNHGVGPFSIYNRGDNSLRPHFSVQFNKYINLLEVNPGVVTCEGFDQPVWVYLQRDQSQPKTNTFSEILSFEIDGYSSSSTTRMPYEVGRTYTITIDSSLQDINGNRLGKDFSFSFVAEPYFRVVGTYPANGTANLFAGTGSITPTIVFNSKVDHSIFSMLQLTPAVGGRWLNESYDSTIVYCTMDSMPAFNTTYAMVVSPNAHDRNGNIIHGEFRSIFSTAPFMVRSTIPSSGIITDLSSAIEFDFSGPVDTSTLRANFTISPGVAGSIVQNYSLSSFVFTPTSGWTGGRQYTVTFSTGLRAVNGTPLASRQVFTFATSPFRVTSTSPSDGSTNVYPGSYIYVNMNASINTASLPSSFRISPAVSGSFSTYSGTGFEFLPTVGLAAGATYTVTIDTTLRSVNGSSLASPYTFSFSTQPFIVSQTYPANGDTGVSASQYVEVYCNSNIDSGSVRSAFSISPAVSGTFELYPNSNQFYFHPSSGLRAGVTYAVTLSTQLRATGGGNLASPYHFWFKTMPFKVTSTYPTSGSTGVSRNVTVDVEFSLGLNGPSAQTAFHISPNVTGYLSVSQGSDYMYFYPSVSLSPNTTYTVTIGREIRSTAGDSLAAPYVFPFTTGQ